MPRQTLAAAVMAATAIVYGQEPAAGWIRALAPNGKSYVWTLNDSGGRGATLTYSCENERFTITAQQSLLAMSDVKDGQIMLAMLSTVEDRKVVEGFLTRDQLGVTFTGEAAGDIKSWLEWTNGKSDPKVMFLLSNNGLRETFTFVNEGGLVGEDMLSCRKPKEPKNK